MMNKSVQHGCAQDATPDFEALKELTEDCCKGQDRGREINRIRAFHSRQNKRDPELRTPIVQGPLSHRWSRRMNLDETYRAPSLFTWRC